MIRPQPVDHSRHRRASNAHTRLPIRLFTAAAMVGSIAAPGSAANSPLPSSPDGRSCGSGAAPCDRISSIPNRIRDGRCRLSRGNQNLFDGPCDLRRESKKGSNRYVVNLDDGRRFSFSNRNGGYEIKDSDGTWPVQIENRGKAGVFRWRDSTLVAKRNGGSGSGSSNDGGPSLGATLGSLFQGLFMPGGGMTSGMPGMPMGPGAFAPGQAYGPMGTPPPFGTPPYGSSPYGSSPYGSPPYGSQAPYGGALPYGAPSPYGRPSPYTPYNTTGNPNDVMGMATGPATIGSPSIGSCVTYGGWSDNIRINLGTGRWLQVQAVDRRISMVTPSGRVLPTAYGSGEWALREWGTYTVGIDGPPGEGQGVRFCLN